MTQTRECTREQKDTVPRMGPEEHGSRFWTRFEMNPVYKQIDFKISKLLYFRMKFFKALTARRLLQGDCPLDINAYNDK